MADSLTLTLSSEAIARFQEQAQLNEKQSRIFWGMLVSKLKSSSTYILLKSLNFSTKVVGRIFAINLSSRVNFLTTHRAP